MLILDIDVVITKVNDIYIRLSWVRVLTTEIFNKRHKGLKALPSLTILNQESPYAEHGHA